MRRGRRQLKRRFHEKYLVADGTQAILGGMNWGTKYALGGESPAAWRDTDSYITGPAVADIQRRFLDSLFFYRAMEEVWHRRRERGLDPQAIYEQAREQGRALTVDEAVALAFDSLG
jgi:phosphatidylserine/phosphatidylglycerophosphate/cardiolipin synthase-like enzyme